MDWHVKIAKRVERQMKKFPKKDVNFLFDGFDEMNVNPFFGNICKIEGEVNIWRKRVGNYRILFEVSHSEKVVSIFNVERRTTTTYRKRH